MGEYPAIRSNTLNPGVSCSLNDSATLSCLATNLPLNSAQYFFFSYLKENIPITFSFDLCHIWIAIGIDDDSITFLESIPIDTSVTDALRTIEDVIYEDTDAYVAVLETLLTPQQLNNFIDQILLISSSCSFWAVRGSGMFPARYRTE